MKADFLLCMCLYVKEDFNAIKENWQINYTHIDLGSFTVDSISLYLITNIYGDAFRNWALNAQDDIDWYLPENKN